MKKSIKTMLSLMLVAVLMVGVIGCGNNDPAPAATPAPAPAADTGTDPAPAPEPVDLGDQVVELKVLNYFDLTSAGAIEEIETVWEAFEMAHPNIKIDREDEYDEGYHNKVEAYAAAGSLPDVMYAWPSGRSSTLHTQKLLKDLGPLVARDGLAANYTEFAMNPANQVGGYMGIISLGTTATSAMYVNMEVLNDVGLQPAKTYSELVEQVPVLRAAGYETIIMANMDTWVMQSCLYSLIVGRFMGENWEQKIFNGETDWTDPQILASLEFVLQMYDDGVIDRSTLALGYGDVTGLFANNGGAYLIDGDWRNGAFLTDSTTGEALIDPARQVNIKITSFPELDVPGVKIPARTNSAVLATGWGINANLEGAELEAAWTLVKWLTGKEVQMIKLNTGGIAAPSRTDIDFGALSLEPMQIEMANFPSTFDLATVVVDGPFAGSVYGPLNDGLQALGLGTITPQEIAEQVQAAFEAWQATGE